MIKKLIIFIISFVFAACASTSNYQQPSQQEIPDFGLRDFFYELYPNKKFIVLSEHDHYAIATRILSSFSTNDLINALSIAYIQLPVDQQYYVKTAFQNTQSLPYNFHTAVAIAATSADEVQNNPTLNSLKNLIVLAYGNMTQDEIQARYYYGMKQFEQNVFNERWNTFVYQSCFLLHKFLGMPGDHHH